MRYKKLSKDFYMQPCLRAAKELIGKILVRKEKGKLYSGVIVETEAYLGSRDAASHSFNGPTKRNSVMFGEGGFAYVYFTYGNHYCVNAVTGKAGVAHAVLIRALEPLEGISNMMKNRGTEDVYLLCRGPGNLCRAMKIDGSLNGASLLGDDIFLAELPREKRIKVKRTLRIGITKNPGKLYRFIDPQSPFVSRINYKKLLKANLKKVSA
ncbi:MAG TPA: DNA-3-methyladenine glycosylase [Ignavibacteria bacterium]|nr:DNA-3-methyladenine glycosylase [Ignavibacteria bacterium]HRF66878.1 DNA-3-methyladenine glycosylase [Ignavibacteria bacterium]HRJ03754.1 DNA-3-methyladenine glycosylase [Ignavibacteria bacterium]